MPGKHLGTIVVTNDGPGKADGLTLYVSHAKHRQRGGLLGVDGIVELQ